jgi:hypothetical protein
MDMSNIQQVFKSIPLLVNSSPTWFSSILLLSSPEGTVLIYLTRQDFVKTVTVPEGEDNNRFST